MVGKRARGRGTAPSTRQGGPRPAEAPRAARSRGGWWPPAGALLFLVALLWRLDFLNRLSLTPLGGSLVHDAQLYWNWSGFLRTHGLLGTNPFFLGPLYPYVLAALRSLVGDSVPHVLVVQATWGALAVVLLADAARRLTTRWLGLAVGLLAAFYEMSVFFDSQVLMESLLFFLESLLLWLVVRAEGARAGAGRLALLGFLVGLIAEGRATSALLLAPLALLALADTARPARARLGAVAALAAGFLLVAAPVAVRNRVVSGEWIPFTYNFGFNLRVGNNPQATGGFVWITGSHQLGPSDPDRLDGGVEADGRDFLRLTAGRSFGASASSAYWSARAWEFVRRQPARAAGLALTKLAMLANRREYPQIENVDEFREVAGPLGLPVVGTFAFLGPLGLAGLWLAGRRAERAGRFLVGYVVVMALGIVPFFVTDRYRHHLVPALMLLAALTLEALVAAARRRPASLRLPTVAALLAGLALTWLPLRGISHGRSEWGIASDLGARLAERGDYAGAEREYARALRLEQGAARPAAAAPGAALERAALYAGYAGTLVQLGRAAEARPWLERAAELAPDDAGISGALADAYARAGRAAQADSIRGRMPALVGGEGRALASRGWQAARAGRFAEAESLFARAVAREPDLGEAWGALIRVQVQQGELPAARRSLERARAGGLGGSAFAAHEALVRAAGGDREGAERALSGVRAQDLAADPTLADAVRVARQLLARSPH